MTSWPKVEKFWDYSPFVKIYNKVAVLKTCYITKNCDCRAQSCNFMSKSSYFVNNKLFMPYSCNIQLESSDFLNLWF